MQIARNSRIRAVCCLFSFFVHSGGRTGLCKTYITPSGGMKHCRAATEVCRRLVHGSSCSLQVNLPLTLFFFFFFITKAVILSQYCHWAGGSAILPNSILSLIKLVFSTILHSYELHSRMTERLDGPVQSSP